MLNQELPGVKKHKMEGKRPRGRWRTRWMNPNRKEEIL